MRSPISASAATWNPMMIASTVEPVTRPLWMIRSTIELDEADAP